MKTSGILISVGGLILLVGFGIANYISWYSWNNDFYAYWSLADKASTIAQKSEYIDKFVTALEGSGLQGTKANLFINTPDTSFDENFHALQSLQGRLHDIQKMEETSFAYQTAIQQITAQEQGQAGDMLDILYSCWQRVHFYSLWNGFISITWLLGSIAMLLGGLFMLFSDF